MTKPKQYKSPVSNGRKTSRLNLRCFPVDVAKWQAAARRRGIVLNTWMEEACNFYVTGELLASNPVPKQEEKKPAPEVEEDFSLPSLTAACDHGKHHGEVCYKCDPKMGYPEIRG